MGSITQQIDLPCTPIDAFHAWLDPEKHAEIIGADVEMDPIVGGAFSLWDGSIEGVTTGIDPESLTIEQNWWYDFPDWPKENMSHIRLRFVPQDTGCTVEFSHTDIPEQYVSELTHGWEDNYWKPMREYFAD